VTTTRRLRGIAAVSAATLATAAMAAPSIAVDECEDEACGEPQISLNDLVKAFGGEEIPEDALIKIDAMYEQLGMEDPAAAFLKLGEMGAGDPEDALAGLAAFYEQLGLGDPAAAFLKLDDAGQAFWKIEEAESASEDAMIKLDDLFIKLGDLEGQVPDEALLKIEDAMPLLEETLLKFGASEDIDPALIKMMLEMLPDEE